MGGQGKSTIFVAVVQAFRKLSIKICPIKFDLMQREILAKVLRFSSPNFVLISPE
jgi:hypothetical protein